MTLRITKGLTPVILGGFIYLTYRTDSLLMFGWFNTIGLTEYIKILRTSDWLHSTTIPNWVIYSLPDALWLFSFTYTTLLLWNFKINKHSIFWICLAPFIGLSSELGQMIGFIPGTFDVLDLVMLLFASALPFIFVTNRKTKNTKDA